MSGGKDGIIIVWDLNDDSNNLVFKGHESPISSICTLQDQQSIMTGGIDRLLMLWDLKEEK